MRRLLTLTAVVALTAAPQALAAPTAGVEDGAGTFFVVTTAAGATYDVRLMASLPTAASSATAPALRVHLEPSGDRRSGDLRAGAFTMTGTGATLSTTLGGVPLRVTWVLSPYSVAASLGEAGSDADESYGWTIAGQGAEAQISFGGVRCTSTSALVGKAVAHDTAGYGKPLSQGLALRLRGARCSSPASTEFPPVP